MPDAPDYYALLRQAFPSAREESRHGGELHIPCPECGTLPKAHKTVFSVSRQGGHCFVCGYGTQSLWSIAKKLGILDGARPQPAARPRPAPAPRSAPRWLQRAEEFVTRAMAHPEAARQWARYKVLPDEVRLGYRLGYGIFPQYSSRCVFPRLTVPMLRGDQIIGVRGRALGREACRFHQDGVCTAGGGRADCAGWMSTSLVQGAIPLFNGARLLRDADPVQLAKLRLGPALPRKRGDVLLIMENPIDALMYEVAYPTVDAVATFSVSYWADIWESAITLAEYRQVVVFYDNDVPGNGNTQAAWDAWRAAHGRDIMPGGVKLVNRLLKADAPASLYPWGDAPVGADPGWLLTWGGA